MSSLMDLQVKRWALDASEWLWGTMQGAFNEKQTTSQIIVDAVVGMIPLVGDATAARDLVAVSIRLADDPKKREETLEWVLLVILLFALIPVIGGVIKGVGRLLLKVGKEAAENQKVLREIIEFLNRFGHGNAVKWLKELDLMRYQEQIAGKFNALMDKLVEALQAIQSHFGGLLSADMKARIAGLITQFKALKTLGGKMIPKALKDLNERLKLVQRAVYQGEWHTVVPGTKNVTREAEARLVEDVATGELKWQRPAFGKYGPNLAVNSEKAKAFYTAQDGYPVLTGRKSKISQPNSTEDIPYEEIIAAFHGPIRPRPIKGPIKLTRVIGIGERYNKIPGNFPASSWWFEGDKVPATFEQWREDYAALDAFNHNGWAVTVEVPAGREVKAWEGTVAEQFDKATGQYLEGGATQLYLDLGLSRATSAEMKLAFERGAHEFTANGMTFKVWDTGWPESVGKVGFPSNAPKPGKAFTQRLAADEIESKTSHPVGVGMVAGARLSKLAEPDKEDQR
jgi:hypothetical protein